MNKSKNYKHIHQSVTEFISSYLLMYRQNAYLLSEIEPVLYERINTVTFRSYYQRWSTLLVPKDRTCVS